MADPVPGLVKLVKGIEQKDVPAYFGLVDFDRLLKTTVSLCPVCLAHVPAVVFTRSGKVYLERKCSTHGGALALLENDERYYHLSNKDRSGEGYAPDRLAPIPEYESDCCGPGGDCTDQWGNKTCTVLVEVTDACNLACAVCYSDSKGDRFLPFEQFKAHLDELATKKKGLDSVQITGGEATLHPQYWQMLAWICARPDIKKIYLPTNGLLLSKPGMVEKLIPYRDRILVLLQFDDLGEGTPTLRNANPVKQRLALVESCSRHQIPMQLTMTLSQGVNERQVGEVVALAAKHEHVKVVAMQPAPWSGRYDLGLDPLNRLTLSDLVKATMAQTPRLKGKESDFVPIPCSHPNCGWITVYVRRFGWMTNLVRYVDLAKVMNSVSYKTTMSTDQIRDTVSDQPSLPKRAVAWLGSRFVRSTDTFTVAIKPFMDRYTYDQDRIANCCHHLLDTNGQPVSFCEYNARLRPRDSWSKFPTRAEVAAL